MTIKNRDIICISSIDWDFVWQGHQEIMSTFAKNGNRVLYIENTGIRTPKLSDIGRLKNRIINWRKGLRGIREESKNLFIYSPLILPFPYSGLAKILNRFILIKSIKVWMKATDFKNPIIWTFLPTCITIDIIDKIDNSLVVYYCIAEFAELADSSKKVNKAEAELLKRSDVVFAQGEDIKERCLKYNKNVHIFPFGVKSDIFLKPANEVCAPADLANIPRPIIGYIGGIHKHIDFKLLKELARTMAQASIVLVGPVQTEEAKGLVDLKNVYFLGKKAHRELPAYIDRFELCLIPYVVSEYTKTVYPTKLNEYLMRGKRVLSTALPEISKFVEKFGDVVYISKNSEDFIKKAQYVLRDPVDGEFSKKAISVASGNSWENRIEEMNSIMERAIDTRHNEISVQWKDSFVNLTRIAKKRIMWIVAPVVILYVLFFHTPFIWWLGQPLKVKSVLSRSDAIVVLGGGVGEGGRPGQDAGERIKYAVGLYNKGLADKLIISSGFVYSMQEADVMKALAVSLGVPSDSVFLEKESKNTFENVKNSIALADKKGYKRLIFISSPYHMRRLKMTVSKYAGKDAGRFFFSPVSHSLFFGDEEQVLFRHINAIFREYISIVYYWFEGYV